MHAFLPFVAIARLCDVLRAQAAAAGAAGLRYRFDDLVDDLVDDPTRASSFIRITGLRKFLYEKTIVAAEPREQLADIDRFPRRDLRDVLDPCVDFHQDKGAIILFVGRYLCVNRNILGLRISRNILGLRISRNILGLRISWNILTSSPAGTGSVHSPGTLHKNSLRPGPAGTA